MTVYPIQANFTRGELGPRLHGRTDLEHYQSGLKTATNWQVLKEGGLRRRVGTIFAGEVKNNAKEVRLGKFEFSTSQSYLLEFGDLYIRFWTNGGRVESGGTPVEVVTPYLEADLSKIRAAGAGDELYIVCEGYSPRILTRSSETSWALSEYVAKDGPYLDAHDGQTVLTPSARNVLSTGTISSSGSGEGNLRDLNPKTKWTQGGGVVSTITINLGGGNAEVSDSYSLQSSDDAPEQTPSEFKLHGSNNNSTWVALDSRSNETGWGRHEIRHYDFDNTIAFRYYRLTITAAEDQTDKRLAEWFINRAGDDQTPFTITASSTNGINNDTGFQSSDIGRSLQVIGSDGISRWCKITARASTTSISVRMYGKCLPDTDSYSRWKLSQWSDELGWPEQVAFFEDRLTFAASNSYPRTLWASQTGDYDNMGVSSPSEDTDALNMTMNGGQLNQIQWIEEGFDLLVGTSGATRTIRANDGNSAITNENKRQRRETQEKCASVEPAFVGETAFFVDASRQSIHEFFYDFNVNGYRTPELSILSNHLLKAKINAVSWQASPEGLLYALTDDGKLAVTALEKAQQVAGMTPFEIAGGSADEFGVVEAVQTISTSATDETWLVVRRTINGATKRYIEYFSEWNDDDDVEDGVFADSALVYSGSATGSVSGLDHLEGETVAVLADGTDIGDLTVASGSITLPNSHTAEKITVGLRYQSSGGTLRLPQAGNKDGTAMGRRKNINSVAIDVLETAGLKAGTASRVEDITARSMATSLDSAQPLATGIYAIPSQDSWRNGGECIFETNAMYPATVRAVLLGVEGEP
ncbi:MAG: discoidin domain-containing protein [Alphaproteobacteria bacterium]|nr:discoidin domain-containing protein [Alphaproteobacteria bacterium]